MKDLYPAKPKTSRVDPAKSAIRKAKVDPTESAMQRSEHLDTLVASIDKAKFDKTRVDTTESATQKSEQFDALGGSITYVIVSSELVGDDPMVGPTTPLSTVTVTSLLDSKKRKRNRTGSTKKAEPQDGSSMTNAEKTVSPSSKRKKKSWTSLKEIAESQSSNSRKFSNISVPFIFLIVRIVLLPIEHPHFFGGVSTRCSELHPSTKIRIEHCRVHSEWHSLTEFSLLSCNSSYCPILYEYLVYLMTIV
ncbi:hypothetical protein R3W88_021737 [Solanum pinnatisectum]|uniref:Uncharacterized protein n=1 Tax=Solanum pinnatisectum TaxID=50273 RepID=A0AAV9LW28_9SOLN|nr:hypothetical protein R3W88_021737 [Solanum pinnatisectum]